MVVSCGKHMNNTLARLVVPLVKFTVIFGSTQASQSLLRCFAWENARLKGCNFTLPVNIIKSRRPSQIRMSVKHFVMLLSPYFTPPHTGYIPLVLVTGVARRCAGGGWSRPRIEV